MTNTGIKRIVVALDASEANRSALLAATSLASQLQAELQALFVEDINLLRLAELPFAREMMFGSHQGRRITLAKMEQQIQDQASRLRHFVETTAQQNKVNVEFKVLRGQISSQLRLAAQQMDLLILSKSSQLLRPGLKLVAVVQEVLATVNCNVLVLQHGATIERPVAVLFDGAEASQRALQVAIQLAQGDHDQLNVIYPAISADSQQALQQQVDTLTQPYGINAGHIQLTSNSPAAVLQTLEKYKAKVIIVEVSNDILNSDAITSLIQQSHIPVIVIR